MGCLRMLKCGLKGFKTVVALDIDNKGFSEVNEVYTAKCVDIKKEKLAKAQHKPSIADEDLKNVTRVVCVSTDNPKTLLNNVFSQNYVIIIIKIVIKKSHLKFSKMLWGTTRRKRGGMMYATEGLFFPVASFEKHLEHLKKPRK